MKGVHVLTQADRAAAAMRARTADRSWEKEKTMNCTQFQSDLPLIIDSGGGPEHEQHLQACEICRDLVSDLRYIADQAKLLVSMEDPSPRVWSGIEEKLRLEGLVKPAVARRPLQRAGERYK